MPIQIQGFEDQIRHAPDHTVVRDLPGLERMVNALAPARALTFDFETNGLAYWAHARPCGVALATRDAGRILSWYVPYRHQTGEPQLPPEVVVPVIRRLLGNPNTLKVAHHVKFDDHMGRRDGIQVAGPRYDTMVGARLYDENRRVALKVRAADDRGHQDAHELENRLGREVLALAKSQRIGVEEYRARFGYSQVPVELCGSYACFDVQYTTELYEFYEAWGLSGLYPRIWPTEMELTRVLCDMEELGAPIDVEYLSRLRDTLAEHKERLEVQLHGVLRESMFNLGNDGELRNFLLDELRLPLTKLTKAGRGIPWAVRDRMWKDDPAAMRKLLSVDDDVLEEFEDHDQSGALKIIREWREAEKIHNTYTTSILDRCDSNGVIHGDLDQIGTNTGRFSSRNPNLQNFAKDSDARAKKYSGKSLEDGGIDPWSVRRAFVVRGPRTPRQVWDYSQIELRVLAFFSRDPIMVETFLTGGDIHKRTSEEIGCDRRLAKVINFGLSYVMTAKGMARQTKRDEDSCEQFMGLFFQRYSGIASFREWFWAQVRKNGGQFSNPFGRTRRVPAVHSPRGFERARAERQAIATLIQGTAAELMKESLVRIARWLRERQLPAQLVSTVHDELWIDTEVQCFAEVARGTKALMEHFPEFHPIPIIADGEYITTNWAEKKPLPAA